MSRRWCYGQEPGWGHEGESWFEWPWPAGGTVSRPFQSIPRVGDRAFRPGRDPVFSRSCSTLEEQRERAGDLFERTVVVKVLRGGGEPILRDDFAEPLSDYIQLKEVIFLATVGRGDEWHITLASKEAKAKLMGAGRIIVAGRRCLIR